VSCLYKYDYFTLRNPRENLEGKLERKKERKKTVERHSLNGKIILKETESVYRNGLAQKRLE
jgi:hypothetical protein